MVNRFIIGICSLSLLLSSCAPIYYPNRVNAPMLDKAKEVNIEGNVGLTGYDFQTAFSPIEHLGVMANFSSFNGSDHNHNFFEGGIGYYNHIGENGLFEIYGGHGVGAASTTTIGYFSENNRGSYNRTFLQPSIGFLNDNANMYFATRMAFVDFGGGYNSLFFEPAFGGRAGGKLVKFNLQIGFSVTTNQTYVIDYVPLIINLGLSITFNK